MMRPYNFNNYFVFSSTLILILMMMTGAEKNLAQNVTVSAGDQNEGVGRINQLSHKRKQDSCHNGDFPDFGIFFMDLLRVSLEGVDCQPKCVCKMFSYLDKYEEASIPIVEKILEILERGDDRFFLQSSFKRFHKAFRHGVEQRNCTALYTKCAYDPQDDPESVVGDMIRCDIQRRMDEVDDTRVLFKKLMARGVVLILEYYFD